MQSTPVHWSKDFVEHLRTVHFALIAVAVGLTVVVLSSKEYNAVTALVELEEIIDLKHNWSPTWMERYGSKGVAFQAPQLSGYIPGATEPIQNLSWKNSGFTGNVMWAGSADKDKIVQVECLFPKQNWYQSDYKWSTTQFPRTLVEFRDWWQGISYGYIIFLPEQVAASGKVVDQLKVSEVGDFTAVEETAERKLQLTLVPDAKPDRPIFHQGAEHWYTAHLDALRVLEIQILELDSYTVTQATIEGQYHNLHPGEYANTFSDLDKATELTSDLSLEDIKDLLHDDAVKGPEVFEVFGMKFPAGQATLWGIILLVSVQLYFFTYLRQLHGKLGPKDPGWDVPWIAMDSSGLAQAIFLTTIVPLPPAALVLLGMRRTQAMHLFSPNPRLSFLRVFNSLPYSAKGEIVALLLASVISLLLAVFSWRFRPRMEEEIDEPTPISEAPTTITSGGQATVASGKMTDRE